VARRILLVAEDHPERRMLAKTLTGHDYSVWATGHLHDAPALFTAFLPDVVLIDLTLWGNAASNLASRCHQLNVPLIILSSSTEESQLAVALGADACLTVPGMVPELLIRIRQFCDEGVRASMPFLVNGADRRSSSRPKRGDVRACPRCGNAMRFEEPETVSPAWICRNITCLNAEFVREGIRSDNRQSSG
jgi:DNA-binding response OmpR family regulator